VVCSGAGAGSPRCLTHQSSGGALELFPNKRTQKLDADFHGSTWVFCKKQEEIRGIRVQKLTVFIEEQLYWLRALFGNRGYWGPGVDVFTIQVYHRT
jgi:hypothetical protein